MEEKELLKFILLQMLNNICIVTASRLDTKIIYQGIDCTKSEDEMIQEAVLKMKESGNMDLQDILEFTVTYKNMCNAVYVDDEVNFTMNTIITCILLIIRNIEDENDD